MGLAISDAQIVPSDSACIGSCPESTIYDDRIGMCKLANTIDAGDKAVSTLPQRKVKELKEAKNSKSVEHVSPSSSSFPNPVLISVSGFYVCW